LREHLSRYEKAGIDQVMFVQQSGANRHEHICDSLEIFASQVMPEFKRREEARAAEKQRELGACPGNSKKRSGQGASSSIRWTV
jgi:hypothetical protein